jgi:predicted branched-subunit amino acid permease
MLIGAPTSGRALERAAFRDGVVAMATPLLGIAIWGTVTGLAMIQAGLDPAQAVGMSLIMYAGSAQLAVLPLLAAGAAPASILLTALLVNLRFVMASALLAQDFRSLPPIRRFVIGVFTVEATLAGYLMRGRDGRTQAQREQFKLGANLAIWLLWQGATLVGIFGAGVLPMSSDWMWVGQLAVLAIGAPLLRVAGSTGAVVVTAVVSIWSIDMPAGVGLALSTVCGACAGLIGHYLMANKSRSNHD